jgi:putative addiction module component (TIGR02574 family)
MRESLTEEVLALSERERAQLAAKLLESLEESPADEVDAAWAAELNKRAEEVLSGSVKMSSWTDVRARLRARIPAVAE